MAAANETECLTSRCGINKDLTVRIKTTASTGPKRIATPKHAVIVEAASPEVAEILSTIKKKRTLSTGPKRPPKPEKRPPTKPALKRVKADGTMATTYTIESVLDNWSESTDYGIAFTALLLGT